MRRFALLLLLLLAPWLLSAQTQPDRTQYFLVKAWRLTGTWNHTKHFRTVEVEGDATKTHTYDAEIWAQAQFRMVQTKAHSSKRYRWELEKGFQPIARVSVRIVDHTVIKPKNSKESWSRMEINAEGKALEGDGRLDIEPADGACRVVAGFMSTPGTIKATNSQGGSQQTDSPFYFSSGMGDCQGHASGMTF